LAPEIEEPFDPNTPIEPSELFRMAGLFSTEVFELLTVCCLDARHYSELKGNLAYWAMHLHDLCLGEAIYVRTDLTGDVFYFMPNNNAIRLLKIVRNLERLPQQLVPVVDNILSKPTIADT